MKPHAASRRSITMLLFDTLDGLSTRDTSSTEKSEVQQPEQAASGSSTLGELLDALDERAFGLMLLLLALPCCIPFLWGIPQIVAVPMIALTAQLALGRTDPWLPEKLRSRPFVIDDMRGIVTRAKRYLGWVERLAHPRLSFLTEGRAVRIVGVLLLIPCASILVPLPSTNTAPGIGVAIASVGLIERDGLLTLFGLAFGLAWVLLLVGVVVLYGPEGVDLLKDAIKGLLGMSASA